MKERPSQQARLLTFRSGGWVLLLGAVLTGGVLVWGLLGIMVSDRASARPHRADEYGFDLAGAIVPLELIAAGSEPGVIRALTEPEMISAAEVEEINERERGKYLVADELVLGVAIEGEARAYPIRILQWHEIVNDTVGGMPVAVTYNGLCDSAAVFDRRIDGHVVEFEVSGLLYNSNLLMVEKDSQGATGSRSLWSQIQARAIAGPAAGTTLAILPCALVSWRQWKEAYPETVVLAPNPDPRRARYYDRDAYGSYQSSDVLKFPVEPLPRRDQRPFKTRMIAVVGHNGQRNAWPVEEVIARATKGGEVPLAVNGLNYTAVVLAEPDAVIIRTPDGALAPVLYSYWFAWFALSNDDSGATDEVRLTQ